jgi:hypothetical protein
VNRAGIERSNEKSAARGIGGDFVTIREGDLYPGSEPAC